jgi:hypothetical protein
MFAFAGSMSRGPQARGIERGNLLHKNVCVAGELHRIREAELLDQADGGIFIHRQKCQIITEIPTFMVVIRSLI